MKLIKRSNLHPTFPSFFDDFFTKDFLGFDRDLPFFTTTPQVNIREENEAYLIEMAIPGLSKEDFNVELNQNLLTISYEKKEETNEEEKGKFTRREFNYTSFSRSFTVPENTVNFEKIDAKYDNGILKLTLPKMEEAKTKAKRTISIG